MRKKCRLAGVVVVEVEVSVILLFYEVEEKSMITMMSTEHKLFKTMKVCFKVVKN